ncbi:hypothetical protein [Rehaibacterium terrae]|jgi:hypothetical protein|uniref:Uncharacterized protein n=1 Tax=Rehaibacterium terrae TaxID=1341696 RepID=A0A7W8DFB9_9GAMM|nr:hypothetical protein [Rehaibacterium terrae]MBB5016099.1 hypothetical protein [Rehaibacterium terrae]
MGAATSPPPAWAQRAFAGFKWCVYALLAANVLLYSLHGTLAETVDTAAWVVLLLLFEWETGGWSMGDGQRRFAHGLRLCATLAVIWACVSYSLDGEWLDFANACAWLGVVVALESELRVDAGFRRFHRLRRGATLGLYALLAAFALAWLWQGEWLDAWDAALWLIAFVAIELNVFGLAGTSRSAAG